MPGRFYAACRLSCGMMAFPFYQVEKIDRMLRVLSHRFGAAKPYLVPIPTYANGRLALMVAGANDRFVPAMSVLKSRAALRSVSTTRRCRAAADATCCA